MTDDVRVATRHRTRTPTARTWTRIGGVAILAASRAADVALTVPVLAATPESELNPFARALGPEAYAVANVIAIVATVALVEGAIIVDRGLHGRRNWRREAITRAIAYGWVAIISVVVVVHNARQLAGVLA